MERLLELQAGLQGVVFPGLLWADAKSLSPRQYEVQARALRNDDVVLFLCLSVCSFVCLFVA